MLEHRYINVTIIMDYKDSFKTSLKGVSVDPVHWECLPTAPHGAAEFVQVQ